VAAAQAEGLQRAVEIADGAAARAGQEVPDVVRQAGGQQVAVRLFGRQIVGDVSANDGSSTAGPVRRPV
jgi:hypothetical protein